MPSNNSQNIILSLEDQINKIGQYGKDQSGVELPNTITKTIIKQNSNGLWSKTEQNVENPYKSSTSIRNEISNQKTVEISNYEGIAIPYDNKITSLTQQINDKKSQIVSKVSEAVGAGCSVAFYKPFTGGFGTLFDEPPPPIVVNGATIGYGASVYKDTAGIKFYDYQSNYLSNSPYTSSNADISTVGQETVVFISSAYGIGNVSTGSTAITGINTGSISVGLVVNPIEGIISAGSTVVNVGVNTVFMSNPGLKTSFLQDITFGYFTTSNTSYSGKGYASITGENNGGYMGTYGTVDGNEIQIVNLIPIIVPSVPCTNIKNEILSLAADIVSLRSQLNGVPNIVTEIKSLKSGVELQKWSEKRSELIIQNTPQDLSNTISTLQNY